jgi:hypothetical protein
MRVAVKPFNTLVTIKLGQGKELNEYTGSRDDAAGEGYRFLSLKRLRIDFITSLRGRNDPAPTGSCTKRLVATGRR